MCPERSPAPFRRPPQAGEWIDRNQPLEFRFEGRSCRGFVGDTVASALLANGETLLGRSFKYHRPRSVLSAAGHDINVLLAGTGTTHIRGDVTAPQAAADYRALNASPSVRWDYNCWLDLFSALLPVGFYYKAFHTPRALFPHWERVIRNKAGLGEVDPQWPTGRVAKRYYHCDLMVVGAGIAGLSAALTAAATGAQVLLIDENARPGGSITYQWSGDSQAQQALQRVLAEVDKHPNITLKTHSTCIGAYEDHWLPVTTPEGIWKVRASGAIFATGLWEQPAVFRNNDLPGVMLASAAQRLLHRYAVAPFRNVVLLIANDAGMAAAADLLAANITISAIVDMRPGDDELWHGVPHYRSAVVYEAKGHHKSLTGVTVCRWDGMGKAAAEKARFIACDGLLMSVGWAPAASLLYQAGGKFGYDTELQQWVPEHLPNGVFACGSLNGAWHWQDRAQDGERAGRAAAQFWVQLKGGIDAATVTSSDPGASRTNSFRAKHALGHPFPIVFHPRGKNFVDFDEDVTARDIEQAVIEGFDNIELLKRFTTVGMGPSQGKHANMNAVRLLAHFTGATIAATGTTTARPLYHPVPMKMLAGRGFRPLRHTPLHYDHLRLGAAMMEAGPWLRPEYYGREREIGVHEEVLAVRQRMGMIDVSTLGKIEVFGPDAATLLDRFYTTNIASLKLGMTRYALAVDESGVVVDDGIVARIADQLFYVTATTSRAAETARELTRHLLMWGLDATVVNLTGQRGALNIAGPHSRAVLQPWTDIDLRPDAFPYLGVRVGRVMGVEATLLRVGFVGELGFEVHVPWQQLAPIWHRLLGLGVRPFGVEAQRRLRLEKGHVIVGQDTDGLSTPFDAGLTWAVAANKSFFVGQRSLSLQHPNHRHHLLGVQLPEYWGGPVPEECCLILAGDRIAGRLTSFAYSPTLKRYIGLAQVDRQRLPRPTVLVAKTVSGALVELKVVATPFYDALGARQKIEYGEVA